MTSSIVEMKEKKPNVRILIQFGIWNFKTKKEGDMAK